MLRYPRLLVGLVGALLAAPLATAADELPVVDSIKELAELSKNGKLFDKEQYRKVRSLCCKAFEERFPNEIKEAYGDDLEALNTWLEKQKEIKEEFYTAIDEKLDKIIDALRIFRDLWKKSPETVAKYANLAIAVAVVWDDPRALYDYRGHQARTKSILPSDYGKMTAVECFQFYVDHQKELKGKETIDRLQALPWEFLVYVVNDKTPVAEREWAIKNYLAKRPMIGRVYSEVAYDHEMLRTNNAVCKLSGHPYTLESIRAQGGVCAMQADFASRVGKSLLVPAAYVGGESAFQGLHAWVMWVEVKSATAAKLIFSLESHGRYLGDLYYTGTLRDPQTGQQILDRDMERRLSAVAIDRQGKRQAELGMRFYDEICDYRKIDRARKVLFLDKCLSLCQFNERAWTELARQVKDGEIDAKLKEVVLRHVEQMLKTFEKYPDFTWKIANDLILIQSDKFFRNQFYERLTTLYEKGGRPDLACEARLKLAEFQGEEEKWMLAAKGLATTIQKFPAEGRYVPKLVTRLQDVCDNYKGGPEFLGQQYLELLKKVPPKRGDEPSKYAIEMHEKAIKFFKDQKGKEKTVKDLETRLASVKAGRS